MGFFNSDKYSDGKVIRWAKKNKALSADEYQYLLDSREKDKEVYIALISGLKELMIETDTLEEKASNVNPSALKQAKKYKGEASEYLNALRGISMITEGQQAPNREQQAQRGGSYKNKAKAEKKALLNDIDDMKKEWKDYTKNIVAFEVAKEKESQKLLAMKEELRDTVSADVDLLNQSDLIIQKAKTIVKTRPKNLKQVKKVLNNLDRNSQEYIRMKNDYDLLMTEFEQMRKFKAKTDSKISKIFEGTKIVFGTLLFGSSNRDLASDLKIRTGGY